MDILEHKEVQLKASEKRVHGLEQQKDQFQAELGRCSLCQCQVAFLSWDCAEMYKACHGMHLTNDVSPV